MSNDTSCTYKCNICTHLEPILTLMAKFSGQNMYSTEKRIILCLAKESPYCIYGIEEQFP